MIPEFPARSFPTPVLTFPSVGHAEDASHAHVGCNCTLSIFCFHALAGFVSILAQKVN